MKTIIITGASAGIGLQTARTFLDAGWHVGLIARRTEMMEDVANQYDTAMALPCDVTDAAAVDAAFDHVAAETGRIDALFNNAGRGAPPQTIDEIDVDVWKAVVDVNLTGMFLCARAAFRHMRTQDPQGGRIINNGSISSEMPRPGSVAYTATKHGVTGLTKTIALDGRPYSIACGQVDIGNAATEMTERMATGVPQADGSTKPEPTMDAQHVADTVLQMANLPLSANVLRTTIMATNMPFVGRG